MPRSDDDGVGPGLPGPRVAAALVLGVLAFGVVVGNAVGPGATAAGAGGRANLTILSRRRHAARTSRGARSGGDHAAASGRRR